MSFLIRNKKNIANQKSWQKNKSKVYATVKRKSEPRRQRKFSRFLFWLLFIGFLAICVYLLLFSPFLDITKISIEGNQDISSEDIESVVGRALEGKYFGIISKDNFFLVNEGNIDEELRNSFNRLEVDTTQKIFPGTLKINVTERKAEIVWCSGGVCYFVDKTGLVYGGTLAPEEELRSNGYLVVVDDSAIPVRIGETKIDPDFIAFAEAAGALIRNDLGLEFSDSIHTPAIASQEISVETNEGWIFKLSTEYSIEDAKKITQNLFEKDLNEDARKNLEYLDLRVKGKVYYKMR